MIRDFNKEGMTAAKDPGIGQQKWDLYQELKPRVGADRSDVRALVGSAALSKIPRQVLARVEANPRPPASPRRRRSCSRAGSRCTWTAARRRAPPAADARRLEQELHGEGRGQRRAAPRSPPDAYRQIATELRNAGVHVSTHAIGDRAIDWVVDTHMIGRSPLKPTRGLPARHHSRQHADRSCDRRHRAPCSATSTPPTPRRRPSSCGGLGVRLRRESRHPARARRLSPLRTFVDKGIKWAGGSDYSVTPFPARYGLCGRRWRAQRCTRRSGRLRSGGTSRWTSRWSLRSYRTIWAAHQLFLDDRIGSIEVRAEAGSRSLGIATSIPCRPIGWKDLKCELTLSRGQIVYRAATNWRR